MRNKQKYCGQLPNHVRIANFSGENRKTSIPSKSSYFFMVLWYGWSCKEVCRTILWVGKQDNPTTLQSRNTMPFEDNEAVIKMILKAEVLQWDTSPEPTELLLIGYSIELIWTQKSKLSTSTPKTNSQTYWPKGTSHVMNGIIFCVCLTFAISVLPIVLK